MHFRKTHIIEINTVVYKADIIFLKLPICVSNAITIAFDMEMVLNC